MTYALISILLNAVAQLVMKRISQGNLSPGALIQEPTTYVVLAIYGMSVLTWLYALRNINLSIAYPLQSLGYVLVTIFSFYLLNEEISKVQLIALTLIVLGSVILVLGS